jgi:1,2-phenylacetyl-CoA epoxidase catalytic subunit
MIIITQNSDTLPTNDVDTLINFIYHGGMEGLVSVFYRWTEKIPKLFYNILLCKLCTSCGKQIVHNIHQA